ncbi:hypothetical protein EYZ11_008013 [Aspergillus tanneri]|uniref:PIG-P domain-containing protein n=1 Tax=Aspergillus tanneri TaxID=1220188 RepID=A0A4S3JBS1_9EURO|nr:hypothetical protein EYZ11_008013 [Aspergillus tanneri]
MARPNSKSKGNAEYPSNDTNPPSSLPSYDSKQPFPPLSPDDLAATTASNNTQDNSYLEDDQDIMSPLQADTEAEDEDVDFHTQYSLDNQFFSDTSTDSESPEDGIAMHHPFRQSTSSLHGPNAFAPPFYNRPPTPLPPSPSLTSLLRPPFSTTTSRPTTPDSSDVETPNDTEAAVANSARRATTVPRASPKVPTYEYYGFVLYLASSLAFSFPSWLVMSIIYIYVALASYNTGYLTLPMNSVENIVDGVANVAVIDGKGRRRPGGAAKMRPGATSFQIMGPQNRKVNWREIWSEGTDAVLDVPVGGVCEVLYGPDRDDDEIYDEGVGSSSDHLEQEGHS